MVPVRFILNTDPGDVCGLWFKVRASDVAVSARRTPDACGALPEFVLLRKAGIAPQVDAPAPKSRDRTGKFRINMTCMLMVMIDLRLPDYAIVFADAVFLDLTGYAREDDLGRNRRFLQGALASQDTVGQIRAVPVERRPNAAKILSYKRNRTPFWNGLFIGSVFGPDSATRRVYAKIE